MSIERIFYCDWRDCDCHIRTASARPQGGFLCVTSPSVLSRPLHFCSWDCILKHAAEIEPITVIPLHNTDEGMA